MIAESAALDCCGERPTIWKCDCYPGPWDGDCRDCDVEKIECPVCDRIVYGWDEESVASWNAGEDER